MCVSQCVYTHTYKYVCACVRVRVCVSLCVCISLQKYLKNAEIWQKILKCHIIYHMQLPNNIKVNLKVFIGSDNIYLPASVRLYQ